MMRRISLWAMIGFAVAYCWFIYSTVTAHNPNLARWTIVAVTAPASLIGRAMPLAYYWFILLNAAIYVLVGLTAELVRPSMIRHRPS
jgi:hypothetical protein